MNSQGNPKPTELSRRIFLKSGAALAAITNFHHAWGGNFLLTSGAGMVGHFLERGREISPGNSTVPRQANPVERQNARCHIVWFERRALCRDGLPADLHCEIWPGTFGLHALVELESFGLAFRGSVQDWLMHEGLFSHLPSTIVPLNAQHMALSLRPCETRLSGDGTLHFRGSSCAAFEILGKTLSSDAVAIGLPGRNFHFA